MQSIREIRKSRGVSVKAAMNAIDVSRPTYNKYEKDPTAMPVGKFVALCEFLHVDTGDIFLPGTSNQIHREEVKA